MTRLTGLWLGAVVVLLGMTLSATIAAAQVDPMEPTEDLWSTTMPRAIQFFPKVTNEDGRKTVIQLSNTSYMPTIAHCFYVNGAEVQGRPLWQITDFTLSLTKQQPTHWCVGDGRPVDPNDRDRGLDAGAIPPVPSDFVGGLVCVQVSPSGEPVLANSLVGKATVTQTDSEGNLVAVSGYNSIGVRALSGGTADNVASLDNTEFAACPRGVHVNFVAEGEADDALRNVFLNAAVPPATSTTLALMPCGADFENLIPGRTKVKVLLKNQFEETLSQGPFDVNCWRSLNLGDFAAVTADSTYYYAKLEAAGADDMGFVAVGNVALTGADGSIATAATNLHFVGNEIDTNQMPSPATVIRLPERPE